MRLNNDDRAVPISEEFTDFSLGIVNGISDAGKRIRHLRRANNAETGTPLGALSCRLGYRDIVDQVVDAEPHSLMEYYNDAGNKVFVGAGTKLYLLSDSLGYVEQSLPITATDAKWSHCNINGVLVACQEDGSNPPIAYNGTAWLSIALPTPGSAPTLAAAAGGSVDAGAHLWRIRWNFTNGSSLVSATASLTVVWPNFTVNLSAIPISARNDYLGFTVERTKVGNTSVWFEVAVVVNAAATTYSDTSSDASLGRIIPAPPGPYGQAPTSGGKYFAGVTVYQNRLLGWIGSTLYCSRAVADVETGAGVFNFHPLENFPVRSDNGAPIWATCQQVDRLMIGKYRTSTHALYGFSPEDFQLVDIYDGAGPVSTRGMCSHGGRVYFYGGGDRMFRQSQNQTEQWATEQVGDYLKEIAPALEGDVVLKNLDGRRIAMFYAATPSTYNEDAVVYRTDHRTWAHWRDVRVTDALVRKRATEFAGAEILFADPKLLPPSTVASAADNSLFAIWRDYRAAPYQYYAQGISNPTGVQNWTPDGTALTANANGPIGSSDPYELAALGLADGGCIFVFPQSDATNAGELRAQRLNAAGVKQWGVSGVALTPTNTSTINVGQVNIVSDGSSDGCIVVWGELRAGNTAVRIFAQRLNGAGAAQWTALGVAVTTGASSSADRGDRSYNVFLDDAGGVFIFWMKDEEAFTATDNFIWGQRLNGSGVAQWAAGGLRFFNTQEANEARENQRFACPDGSAGAIVGYTLTGTSVQASRVDAAGAVTWTSPNINPTPLLATATLAMMVTVCSDGLGGAFIAWIDFGGGFRPAIRRVNASGLAQWSGPINIGPLTSSGLGIFQMIDLVMDGSNGVYAQYLDPGLDNLTVVRISKDGVNQFGTPLLVGNLVSAPEGSTELTTDGVGGFVTAQTIMTASALYPIVKRYDSLGNLLWQSLLNNDNHTKRNVRLAFAEAPQSQVPSSTVAGYHVWSMLDGTTDARPRTGTVGTKIRWLVQLPEYDGGSRDTLKDFTRLAVQIAKGRASISATVRAGDAATAVSLEAEIPDTLWAGDPIADTDETLYWAPESGDIENPTIWSGEKPVEAESGIAPGTVGTRCTIELSAEIDDEFVIPAIALDYLRLPDRSISRTR